MVFAAAVRGGCAAKRIANVLALLAAVVVVGGSGPASGASPILLRNDGPIPISILIDGEPVGEVGPRGLKKITVGPGEHLLQYSATHRSGITLSGEKVFATRRDGEQQLLQLRFQMPLSLALQAAFEGKLSLRVRSPAGRGVIWNDPTCRRLHEVNLPEQSKPRIIEPVAKLCDGYPAVLVEHDEIRGYVPTTYFETDELDIDSGK